VKGDVLFVVNHIHFTMRKSYIKPCLTVDYVLPEGDILGLSELGISSFVIQFADCEEIDLPSEADDNLHQKDLWADEDDI
jgi:hypothetical protein